jgi:sugar phosphate isomerase/epimerase
VAGKRLFGISTHLYHSQRLSRDHLIEIGTHGFETVELFATRTHFDYHNQAAVADLQQWLAEGGLTLHGVHAPVTESYLNGRWGTALTLASSDDAIRERALAEAELALQIARRIPFDVFVVHLGLPRTHQSSPADNNRDAARRSIERLRELADPLGVRIAIEIIPNELSRAGSLVHFVEHVLDLDVGICLDFGPAHLHGDLIDAVETVSEYVITTDVHDNRGRSDDHLVPFDGTFEWMGAMIAIQKVGYEGPMVLEVRSQGPAGPVLQAARKARERMETMLVH